MDNKKDNNDIESFIKPSLFAVSRVFAEAHKQMTLSEYKTFTLAMCSIKWKGPCPDVISLDKKTVANLIGIKSDSNHLSVNLKRSIGMMPQHSFLQFSNKETGKWINGCFVTSISFDNKCIRLCLNKDYLPLFGNLSKNYITLWSEDILRLNSDRTVYFYEFLRGKSDTRFAENSCMISIRNLKEMFSIPKDGKGSYMTKDGHFARTHFEQKVLDPICEALKNTSMIQLVVQSDGKYYEKIKQGNRIVGYRFDWILTLRPTIASATEVKQIQNRVDKDPLVLKTAKDLLKGENKKKSEKQTNAFSDFQQRDYDFDKLEEALLDRSRSEEKGES